MMTSLEKDETKKLESGRRLARRRMGWLAFSLLGVEFIALMCGILWGDEAFRLNLAAAAPALTGLSWALMGVVGAYLGVSLTEALKKK